MMHELAFTVLLIIAFVAGIMSAYSFGRADGIKWTRDVYNGKYDDEIFKDKQPCK